jgi:hypothetical protein
MILEDIVKWLLNFFELAAALAGTYYLHKWKHTHWQWLTWFLWFIVVTELLGKFLHYDLSLRKYNYMVYRYANLPVTVFFYLWLLFRAFKSKLLHRLIWLHTILYVAAWLVEEFCLPARWRKGISRSYIFGFMGILAFIIAWFNLLVRHQQVVSYKRNMQFWINTGLLFYIVTLPFSLMRTPLFINYPDIFMVYWYTSFVFMYIMYTFFILGFKWADPKAS